MPAWAATRCGATAVGAPARDESSQRRFHALVPKMNDRGRGRQGKRSPSLGRDFSEEAQEKSCDTIVSDLCLAFRQARERVQGSHPAKNVLSGAYSNPRFTLIGP